MLDKLNGYALNSFKFNFNYVFWIREFCALRLKFCTWILLWPFRRKNIRPPFYSKFHFTPIILLRKFFSILHIISQILPILTQFIISFKILLFRTGNFAQFYKHKLSNFQKSNFSFQFHSKLILLISFSENFVKFCTLILKFFAITVYKIRNIN